MLVCLPKPLIKTGFPPDFSHIRDPHTVAAILKLFFRELPEPIFISDYYDDFVRYCSGVDPWIKIF